MLTKFMQVLVVDNKVTAIDSKADQILSLLQPGDGARQNCSSVSPGSSNEMAVALTDIERRLGIPVDHQKSADQRVQQINEATSKLLLHLGPLAKFNPRHKPLLLFIILHSPESAPTLPHAFLDHAVLQGRFLYQ